jgi:2-aminoethylphosphonate-pyruvate transaminase
MSNSRVRKLLLNPGPGTTSERVKQALLVSDICPRESEFGSLMKDIGEGLLQLGQAQSSHEVALFAASGTGAIEAMLGSAISQEDHVLIITNGAYGFRMKDICTSLQLSHDTFGSFGVFPDLDILEQKLKNGRYTHLAMVHHETSTGMLNPLEAVGTLTKQYGITYLVDAMSSFGAYPMKLEDMGVDYIAASSNKCIQGMAGLSFVIFNRRELSKLEESNRGFYFDLYRQWDYFRKKHQLRFTPPVQVCYAFFEAILETLEEGVLARRQRYAGNWEILYEGMKKAGFHPFLPFEQESRILFALHLGHPLSQGFDHFHDALYQRNITVYPGVIPEIQTFRMAVIGDLYPEDMHEIIRCVNDYLGI